LPDLNAFAERWVKSLKEEGLDHFIVFGVGVGHLDHLTTEYAKCCALTLIQFSKDRIFTGTLTARVAYELIGDDLGPSKFLTNRYWTCCLRPLRIFINYDAYQLRRRLERYSLKIAAHPAAPPQTKAFAIHVATTNTRPVSDIVPSEDELTGIGNPRRLGSKRLIHIRNAKLSANNRSVER